MKIKFEKVRERHQQNDWKTIKVCLHQAQLQIDSWAFAAAAAAACTHLKSLTHTEKCCSWSLNNKIKMADSWAERKWRGEGKNHTTSIIYINR